MAAVPVPQTLAPSLASPFSAERIRRAALGEASTWSTRDRAPDASLKIIARALTNKRLAHSRAWRVWAMTVSALSQKAQLAHLRALNPDILGEPLGRPVFVTGPPGAPLDAVRDLLATHQMVATITGLPLPVSNKPSVRAHSCRRLLRHCLTSLEFAELFDDPVYRDWLTAQDLTAAFTTLRQDLQTTVWGRAAGPLVLIDPIAGLQLDRLAAVFPEAVFVRIPSADSGPHVQYCTELEKLWSSGRRGATDPTQAGAWSYELNSRGEQALRLLKQRQPERIITFSCHERELIEQLEAIHTRCGRGFDAVDASRARRWLSTHGHRLIVPIDPERAARYA